MPKVVFDANVQDPKVKEDFNTVITTRTKWTRGLRSTGEAFAGFSCFPLWCSQFKIVVFFSDLQTDWPGGDDMVRYWRYLGVVREVKGTFAGEQSEYTAFLEDERVSM